MGAYLQLVTPGIPLLGAWIYAGPYAIPNYDVTFTGVFTNTTPTDAYRGAGRPEATYVLERTMDMLAKELGIDRVELRRRNFIAEFPATMASGLTIDGGDYHASLDRLLEHLGLDEIEAEQQSRGASGATSSRSASASRRTTRCAGSRRRGSSARSGTGRAVGADHDPLPPDRHLPGGDGHLAARAGAETAWSQIVADRLGVRPVDEVEVLHGDTSVSPYGMDTYGSRSLPVGGAALWTAGEKIIEKAREIVAHQLEVSADDLEYGNGTFTVKGSPDKEMTVKECGVRGMDSAQPAGRMKLGLEETATLRPGKLLVARRLPCRGRRGGYGDRRGAARSATSRSTTSAGDEPADRRRAGARWDHAGDRDRAVRGGDLRRRRQPPQRGRWRCISSRRRRSCPRTSSTGRRRLRGRPIRSARRASGRPARSRRRPP